MSAGCIGCGACCDPVQYNVPSLEAKLMLDYDDRWRDADDVAWIEYYANVDWILGHWHDNGDGTATCDAYDRATKRCTAHDVRPPICRDFPWYGLTPLDAWRAKHESAMIPACSYQADLPTYARSADWQPIYDAVGLNLG